MNLQIQSVNFTASEKLEDYIDKRVAKLQNVFDRIVRVEVYLKLESHQQIKDKITELKVHIPGTTLFSSETAKTFEEATDLAVESLRRQLQKRKEKLRNNFS